MHALRTRTLLRAVEALLHGRRLTLMDVARAWPRAAVPIGGRTLPVLDMVFPGRQQGTPGAERHFLERLRRLIPENITPIPVTDVGFRAPWFRTVAAMGWHWVGRLRHRTLVRPVDSQAREDWVPSRSLYELGGTTPRDLGLMETIRNTPWACRIVLHRKAAKGRTCWTKLGTVSNRKNSLQAAAREREPWLIVAAPAFLSARQLVALYARRMQIELSFRDLKSHRYGQGFEDSLTRSGRRLDVLLLVHAMAMFAARLVGLACEATGVDKWLYPTRPTRKIYSILRVGREALVRGRPMDRTSRWIERPRPLSPALLDQMRVAA